MSKSERASYYQGHLDQVSRSFAFCIAELKSPLRDWVGLSYLLCRVADTVEDSPWPKLADQQKAYQDLILLVLHEPSPAQLQEFKIEMNCPMPDTERRLIDDIETLIGDLHRLDAPVRKALQQTLTNMIRGMRHFSETTAAKLELRLHTLSELNQYCFFVAGIVGELLTDLAQVQDAAFASSPRQMVRSFHFGLFLQKINILKDQIGDEKEGRHLVPDRAVVESSVLLHAEESLKYILSIPDQLADYKLFCAWSFYLGLISLPWIQKSWQQQKPSKISKIETFAYLTRVKLAIRDNDKLQKMFDAQMQILKSLIAEPRSIAAPSLVAPQWFQQAYTGALDLQGGQSLGLFADRSENE